MNSPEKEAFERGEIAGRIEARLNGHDQHFAAINGSMASVAAEMHNLTLAVQGLRDQAIADAATVLKTASALKDAEEARRDKSEQSWTPLTRAFAVIATIATIIGVYLTLRG